ncbi:hypothetical protein E1301_Tti011572 [Triplophysa tibetana]|uniref:C2 domain-containing protein n=1 Tax=Triplophysa tibetana TaxID=1572043 RepID=A0A5A9PG30_9TELE|nr:hypothetical protein E1301_Tti011572 [Triplophysa tibetana]
MAFLNNVRLACLAMLMLALHLELTRAAVQVTHLRATNLSGADAALNEADAYVKVWCGDVFGGMTEHSQGDNNPWWSAEFNFPNCQVHNILMLEVWDKDMNYDDKLFTCTRPLISGTHDIICNESKGTLYYKYLVY